MPNPKISEENLARARKIKLLVMDCDGVLTDGRLYFSEAGEALKVFHVRDGQGLVMWRDAGFRAGIISGRNSKIVERRAAELGIEFVKINSKDKEKDALEIIESADAEWSEVAYIGDDLPDVCLMKKVGFAVAVADAVGEVLAHAHYVAELKGGRGAVREVTDLLLKSKDENRWTRI